MSITAAIICAVVYAVINWLDPYTLSWQCLNRPIVVAPLVGLLLGDFQTGIIMGASLEAIFMGISAVGGSIPSDCLSGSIIAVAYAIVVGGDGAMETGLALSLTIGTVMTTINTMLMPLWAGLAPYWERLASECKPNKFRAISMVNLATLADTNLSALLRDSAINETFLSHRENIATAGNIATGGLSSLIDKLVQVLLALIVHNLNTSNDSTIIQVIVCRSCNCLHDLTLAILIALQLDDDTIFDLSRLVFAVIKTQRNKVCGLIRTAHQVGADNCISHNRLLLVCYLIMLTRCSNTVLGEDSAIRLVL